MKILASVSPGEVRVVAWNGGAVDAAVWRPGSPDGVGDLYRGRIGKVVPAMAGAFVVLGGEEGFLPDSAGARGLHEGASVAVQVTRAAQGGKGPRLAAVAREIGIGHPGLIARGPDAVTRLAGLHPAAPVIVDDHALLGDLRGGLGDRVTHGAAFDDAVESAFAALLEPVVALAGGARLHVQVTPALTALDIDLGSATAERRGKAGAQAAANRALLPGVAAQIRLRNLSGAILVDFGGMAVKQRGALGPGFAAALAGDPLQPRFLGFSGLGLAEILRPRVHPPLAELTTGALAQGLAALREAAARVAARPDQALELRASPAVLTALRVDAAGLAAFAHRAGRPIGLVEVRHEPISPWTIEAASHV